MLRRSQGAANLVPIDPEIEATARTRQGRARRQRRQMREGRNTKEVNTDPVTTPLRDFTMPNSNAIPSSIVGAPAEANNFQFNPAFITLFQQDQFGG